MEQIKKIKKKIFKIFKNSAIDWACLAGENGYLDCVKPVNMLYISKYIQRIK